MRCAALIHQHTILAQGGKRTIGLRAAVVIDELRPSRVLSNCPRAGGHDPVTGSGGTVAVFASRGPNPGTALPRCENPAWTVRVRRGGSCLHSRSREGEVAGSHLPSRVWIMMGGRLRAAGRGMTETQLILAKSEAGNGRIGKRKLVSVADPEIDRRGIAGRVDAGLPQAAVSGCGGYSHLDLGERQQVFDRLLRHLEPR